MLTGMRTLLTAGRGCILLLRCSISRLAVGAGGSSALLSRLVTVAGGWGAVRLLSA